jgi:DNA gyrase subunit B
LVELLIQESVEDKNFLQDQQKMSALRALFIEKGYQVDNLTWNEERDVYETTITGSDGTPEKDIIIGPADKSSAPIKIGRGLIYSSDYQKCMIKGKNIAKYDFPPFHVFTKDKEDEAVMVKDKQELLDLVMNEGKKGINVQRYKGLGEMNPDQLWHTTMNPEKRILLQVKVEDMVDTDEIFTILMGEEVEPRREFIQSNALEVSTLDI